jgi:hypothetical protein
VDAAKASQQPSSNTTMAFVNRARRQFHSEPKGEGSGRFYDLRNAPGTFDSSRAQHGQPSYAPFASSAERGLNFDVKDVTVSFDLSSSFLRVWCLL